MKKWIVYFFLDIGNPFALTWAGRVIYQISVWLAKYVDQDYPGLSVRD